MTTAQIKSVEGWPPIHLHLIFEISSLKNQVGRTGFFVYFNLDFYSLCSLQKSSLKYTKNPVRRTRYFKSQAEMDREWGRHQALTYYAYKGIRDQRVCSLLRWRYIMHLFLASGPFSLVFSGFFYILYFLI